MSRKINHKNGLMNNFEIENLSLFDKRTPQNRLASSSGEYE